MHPVPRNMRIRLHARTTMFFSEKIKRFPHLVAFLREFDDQVLTRPIQQRQSGMITAGVIALAGLVVAMGPYTLLLKIAGVVVVPVASYIAAKLYAENQKATNHPEFEPRLRAYRTVGSLRALLDKNRLHRDITEGTLTVLEATAQIRFEIRNLLDTAAWRREDLPETYRRLRAQALDATDQAMIEAVSHLRPFVPEHVESRKVSDYVNEAVETFVFSGPKTVMPEPAFDEIRSIADKMLTLKEELIRAGEEVDSVTPEELRKKPVDLLDLTLSDLKHVRQAEEELREEL